MLFADANSISTGAMAMGLFGGLAIFLFGMEQMTTSLKIVAGERMKSLLAKLTANRFKGVFAGAFVTSVIQSSSVTTVLVVGFVSAGLMSLSQAIGVIMGAEIGTTITAQIIAFKITRAALLFVAIGFAIQFLAKQERLRQYGTGLLGFGLLFFGMNIMSEATQPLREFQPFINAAQHLDSPAIAILLSAAFTAIVQSSSATTVLIIVLAGQGLISLEQAIPLVFGANIGTCVTALLASIGKPREAVRAAVVHVTFNTLGVLLWFSFIDQLAWIVQQLAAETPRQIAHAHTIFNVANTTVFIWFTSPLAWLVTRMVPDRAEPQPMAAAPRYLDDILLQTPALALDIVRMELGRLGAVTLQMVRKALQGVTQGSQESLDALAKMDNDVDGLHGAIVTYLGRLSQENLSDRQSEQLHDYLAAANNLENIGDLVETNLVDAGRERLRLGVQVSYSTEEILAKFHRQVCWSLQQTIKALVESDKKIAREVMECKPLVNKLARDAEIHLTRRLAADEPHRLAAFRLESETIEYFKRAYYFAKRIAKDIAEVEMAYVEGHKETSDVPEQLVAN